MICIIKSGLYNSQLYQQWWIMRRELQSVVLYTKSARNIKLSYYNISVGKWTLIWSRTAIKQKLTLKEKIDSSIFSWKAVCYQWDQRQPSICQRYNRGTQSLQQTPLPGGNPFTRTVQRLAEGNFPVYDIGFSHVCRVSC